MHNADKRLNLRQAADPSLWDPNIPGVSLTAVALRGSIGAQLSLSVFGIARQTPQFVLIAQADGIETNTPVMAAGVAGFEATIAIPAETQVCALIARATDSGGGRDLDRAVFFPREAFRAALPAGTPAGLPASRHGFLAGTPDRSIERRSFSLLVKPTPTIKPDFGDWARKDDDTFIPIERDRPFAFAISSRKHALFDTERYRLAYARSLQAILDAPERVEHQGPLGRAFGALQQQAFDSARRSMDARARKRIERAVAGATSDRGDKPTHTPADTAAHIARRLGWAQLPEGTLGLFLGEDGAQWLVVEKADAKGSAKSAPEPGARRDFAPVFFAPAEIGQIDARFGDLGVLFYDRLRFRPAGLVVGEPLYTLALAPGEEVQLRQSVETKRRALLEEIEDREQESGLTLTSTWSTDVSDNITDTANVQSGMQFKEGVNASGASLGVPIGADAGITASASEAYSLTEQRTVRLNRQITAQAVAKMRQQHKTRIEITNERSSALATTRTVRNANLQRPVSYVFSKVYRREQVLLERYGARLCLRWRVDDPARSIRALFLRHIDRLDPDRLENYADIAAPDIVTATEEFEISMKVDDPNYVRGDMATYSSEDSPGTPAHKARISGEVQIKLPSATAASDDQLAHAPDLAFVSMHIRDEGPTRGQEKRRVSESLDEWQRIAGKMRYTPTEDSAPGKEKGRIRLDALMEYNHKPGNRWDGRNFLYGPTSVKIRVTATWSKSSARKLAEKEPIASRRRDLINGLNIDRLISLRDTFASDYAGAVLAAALRDAVGDIGAEDADTIRNLFAIVENIPYWATETGRNAQRELQDRLQRLPLALPVSDFTLDELTASQAIVYLPIREGAEVDALLTTGATGPEHARTLAQQLRALREQRFGSARRTTIDFDEATGPAPPSGTPAAAEQWKTDWERPLFKFDVLAAWSELVPTDGVHMDALLSDSVATDEQRTAALEHPAN
jgi:hypothetical protein